MVFWSVHGKFLLTGKFKKTGETIAGKNEKGSAVKEDSGKRYAYNAIIVLKSL